MCPKSHGQIRSLGHGGTTAGFPLKSCFGLSYTKWITNDKRALGTGEVPRPRAALASRDTPWAGKWLMWLLLPRETEELAGERKSRIVTESKSCRTAGTWTASPYSFRTSIPFPLFKQNSRLERRLSSSAVLSEDPSLTPDTHVRFTAISNSTSRGILTPLASLLRVSALDFTYPHAHN